MSRQQVTLVWAEKHTLVLDMKSKKTFTLIDCQFCVNSWTLFIIKLLFIWAKDDSDT